MKMKLKTDFRNMIFVWIDEDTNEILSPHFDYEEDAIQWKANYWDARSAANFNQIS